jgi:hypothetical protein
MGGAEAEVRLRCGTLRLRIDAGDRPWPEFFGFACRRNRKRGFVFLSKVLGKHLPVRPGVIDRAHAELAARLPAPDGPAVVVGLAETATALGEGVAQHFRRRAGRDDLLFVHSTRYRLDRPVAFGFREGHSHAPAHLVYEPADPGHARLFRSARTLILVDDELSTGRTLAGLANEYRRLNPRLDVVRVACLTDWLTPGAAAEFAATAGLPATFHSLLRGGFMFEPDPAFDPGPVPDVTGRDEPKDAYLPRESGRLGNLRPAGFEFESLTRDVRPGERLLVLGTGEFMDPPLRLALELERRGWDVHFQATTRSPLLVGEDVRTAVEFADNYHDGIPNYLYNFDPGRFDRVLIGYETRPLPGDHRLPELVGGTPLFF